MNLVHSPLIEPPGLKALAASKYPNDLGPNELTAGHMITYMDSIVGKFIDKVQELGIEENTLIIFTGDNGSANNLVSRLGPLEVRGGKRTMNEAGTRVPFMARWPAKIRPGVREGFFSLLDVLPTLSGMAGVSLDHVVDGMDLSHSLLGTPGEDRHYFPMAFEGDVFFVRDDRHRLHEDGRFYNVSVSSDQSRYSMESLLPESEAVGARQRLQEQLDAFMTIRKTDNSYRIVPFGTGGDNFKNAQDRVRSANGEAQ
jgi:arylsulfatase A